MAAPHQADQLGRLIRPAEVLEAHEACTEGRIELNQLREVEGQGPHRGMDNRFHDPAYTGFRKELEEMRRAREKRTISP